DAARAAGMPAVAVTDHVNLFGMGKFYRAALAAGVKPIVGADLLLDEGPGQAPARLTLLVQSRTGYRNLCELLSRAYMDGHTRVQVLCRRDWVPAYTACLIASSGGMTGDVGMALRAGKMGLAEQRAADGAAVFADRYSLEITRSERSGDEAWLAETVDLA